MILTERLNLTIVSAHVKSRILLIAALAVASLLSSYYGLGVAYHERLNPNQVQEDIQQIGTDGKLSTGASITYRHLSSIGNALTLALVPVRPNGFEKPRVSVSACGAVIDQFTVDDAIKYVVPIHGACDPYRVELSVDNPYLLPGDPTPRVGVRMIYVDVSSPLRVPLVTLRKGLTVFFAIFGLGSLWVFLSPHLLISFCGFVAPIAAYFLVRGNDGLDLSRQYPLWLFAFLLSCGAMLFKTVASRASEAIETSSVKVSSKISGIAIALIVACGAAVRLYGISFGLPLNFHPDEVPKVNAIMRMYSSGTLNPNYFLHPSLLLYLSYFTNLVFHFFGNFFGVAKDFRSTQFLAGRCVSTFAGTYSLFLVYALGKRFFSSSAGLLAAALLAFSPLHVTCSRYMKEDALLTFFVLAATLAMIKAAQENKKLFLYLSGALVGFAAGSKYPGVLASVIVCSAPWVRSKSFKPDFSFFLPTVTALLLVPIFFVISTPYSVITPATFLRGLAYEHNHMEKGHSEVISAWSQLWMYHFWRSIVPGLTPLTAFLSIVGAGFLLWRRKINDLFILGIILTFYLPAEWVKAKPAPQPERYIMPCLPFLLLALSGMYVAIRGRGRKVATMLAVLAVVSSCVVTVELASEVPHDTRLELASWMKENLPKRSRVIIDVSAYGPALGPHDFKLEYLPRLTIFAELQAKSLKRSNGDFLVLSSLFYNRYFSQPNSGAVFRQLFRDLANEFPIVRIEAPKYGTYGFHNPRLIVFSLKPEDVARLKNDQELKREGKLSETSNDLFGQYW